MAKPQSSKGTIYIVTTDFNPWNKDWQFAYGISRGDFSFEMAKPQSSGGTKYIVARDFNPWKRKVTTIL